MQLDELQQHWNAFGRTDPLWAILTSPDKRNGGWTLEEFFQTGKAEINAIMQSLSALNWTSPRRRALDFGCGVGRLTQALCDHFEECCGVDIAIEMLRLADEFNQHEPRCSYLLNATNDLCSFSDNYFDFVYSNIALQHMKPEYALNYIREFLRVLAPSGFAVFQLPSEMLNVNPAVASARLPELAYRSSIVPLRFPHTVAAGAVLTIPVVVKNVSQFTWPRYCVRLGNHWLTDTGAVAMLDDGRAEFSRDLPSGVEEQITLTVTAPSVPGMYQIELDMVHECVAWFKQHGSETAIFPVKVEAAQSGQVRPSPATFKCRMEMYGTPLEEVVGIVVQSGGRFVEIKQDDSAGSDWLSYRYTVTKDEHVRIPPVRYFLGEFELPAVAETDA